MMSRVVVGLLIVGVGAWGAFGTEACAHRGDVKHAPENTIPALVLAVEKGAPQIEFDVQLTKDGELVLMHDSTIDRTTDGTGAVGDYTLAELKALDAGSWFDATFAGTRIPTLREALEVIPESILCNVHLKNSPGVAEATAKVIQEMGRVEQCFLAATLEQAEEARAIVPELRMCNMSRQGNDRELYVTLTLEHKSDFIQFLPGHKSEGLKEAVERLHAGGVKVNFFKADDPEGIRALAEAGVDYILTDDLDVCLEVLREMKEAGAGGG